MLLSNADDDSVSREMSALVSPPVVEADIDVAAAAAADAVAVAVPDPNPRDLASNFISSSSSSSTSSSSSFSTASIDRMESERRALDTTLDRLALLSTCILRDLIF